MGLTNYHDIGKAGSDTHAGFQFEFHCGNCSRKWKSPFEPYRRGQLAGFVYGFARYLGGRGLLFRASSTVADAGADRARRGALERALGLAEQRYIECPACEKAVCENCWDERSKLCEPCAGKGARSPTPRDDDQAQAQAGAAHGARAAAAVGSAMKCPNCSAAIGGGRFCEECGFDMASTHKSCPGCGTLCTRAARFCTDCGHGF